MRRKNYGVYPNATVNTERFEPCNTRVIKATKLRNYTIHITEWKSKDPEKHYWSQMSIKVLNQAGECCAEFGRNYYSFEGIVVTQNGVDYLITSSDYQCITICNLQTGAVTSYTDLDDIQHGCGFCPIYFDWDEGTLYVDGCIWACPYETMKCEDIDLDNPIPSFNTAEWIDEDGETYNEEDDEDDA